MRAAWLVILVLGGCESSRATAPDASPDACDAAYPGVRVHLMFASDEIGDPSGPRFGLQTSGGDAGLLSQEYDPSFTLDASHEATVILRYPTGTVRGSATVSYYAIVATINFVGTADFAADPTACVDVNLAVAEQFPIDAGM